MKKAKLCLGTVQFGLDYGINNSTGKPSQAQSFQMLDLALQSGIDVIDTAQAYGTAEELLGCYNIAASSAKVISKLQPNSIEPDRADVERVVREHLQQSLKQIGLQTLDGYLLHTPEYYYDRRILQALRSCRDEGLIRHFGVSIYETEHALDVVREGVVDYIQIPYSVFDQRLDRTEFFSLAKQNGVTVFARSAFLQGLILMDDAAIPQHLAEVRGYLKKLDAVIEKHAVSRLQAALLFSQTHPGIDYLVFGVDTMEQLQEDLALAKAEVDFAACREELAHEFIDVKKSIIFPSLWKRG